MKLPVPGFVSQALSSLINNDRREKRIPFDKTKAAQSKAPLKFKEVSKEEREALVQEILRKRRRKWLVAGLVAGILLLTIILIISLPEM